MKSPDSEKFSHLYFTFGDNTTTSQVQAIDLTTVHGLYVWRPEKMKITRPKANSPLMFSVVLLPCQLRVLEFEIPAHQLATSSPRKLKRRSSSLRKRGKKQQEQQQLEMMNNSEKHILPDTSKQIIKTWVSTNTTVTIQYEPLEKEISIQQVSIILETRKFLRKTALVAHKVAAMILFDEKTCHYLGRAQRISTVPALEYRSYSWLGNNPKLGETNMINTSTRVGSGDYSGYILELDKLGIAPSKNNDLRLLVSPRVQEALNRHGSSGSSETVLSILCDDDTFSNGFRVLSVKIPLDSSTVCFRFYNLRYSRKQQHQYVDILVKTALFKPKAKKKKVTVQTDDMARFEGELVVYYSAEEDSGDIFINMIELGVRKYKKALNFAQNLKNMTF